MKTILFALLFCLNSLLLLAQTTADVTNLQYIIKIIPAQYETIYETIEIAPELNGDLDTANYFVEVELVEIQSEGAEWEASNSAEGTTLFLVKTPAKHQLIEKRFYPYKHILKTAGTDNIIPAQVLVIERKVKIAPAKIEYHVVDPSHPHAATFATTISADDQHSIRLEGVVAASISKEESAH